MDSQSWGTFDNTLRIKMQRIDETRGQNPVHTGHSDIIVTEEIASAGQEYRELTQCIKETIDEVVPAKGKQRAI